MKKELEAKSTILLTHYTCIRFCKICDTFGGAVVLITPTAP